MHPTLITADDTATGLGISRRTLQNWSTTGKFPRPIYIGRRAYYQQGQVDTFIQERITHAN